MLILSRNIGQKIRINDDITIIVVGFQGNKVRVGIEAPKDMIVDREEIHKRRIDGQKSRDNGCSHQFLHTGFLNEGTPQSRCVLKCKICGVSH